VTEHFAYLVQGSTLLQHVRGEAVTKEVRTLAHGFDTCFYERTRHDLGDRVRDAEPEEGSVITDENPAAGTSRAVAVQILRYGMAHVCRQRQLCPYSTFSADRDPSALPIDVLKVQSHDFARPETKSSQ
jgi:hypothetical protein